MGVAGNLKGRPSSKLSLSNAQQLVAGTWSLQSKHYFDTEPHIHVTTTGFSHSQSLLTAAFSSGIFSLYELPSFVNIHTLSISNHPITSVRLNPNTVEWIAFGIPQVNALLVWDWRSESYILKQQGHSYGIRCVSYSRDDVCLFTGEDGRIKLWNATSGFCFVTLKSEHTAPVTAVAFPNRNPTVLLSSGLDGVVKAYDLTRYRHFKTLATSTPTQLSCLDVVDDIDVVVAGSCGDNDSYAVYVWNLQTAQLLDILSGHKGPVTQLFFSPLLGGNRLATASWDATVKVWDLYTDKGKAKDDTGDTLTHSSEVVCSAWLSDGNVICAGTLQGMLQFWDAENTSLFGEVHGQKDIMGGRKENDRMTSDKNTASLYFTSVCYSADGTCVLAGGNSKYICIYEVSQRMLLKKFQITFNRSLDGVLDELNSKQLGDGGPVNTDPNINFDDPQHNTDLPGAKRLEDGTCRSRQEVLTRQVQFTSTGREFAVISTEGYCIFSLDGEMVFDPIGLTENVTPDEVNRQLLSNRYGTALRMASHLNEFNLVHSVIEGMPLQNITHVVKVVPPPRLDRLMQYLSKCMVDGSPHLEFYVEWCLQLLLHHGVLLQKRRGSFMRAFRTMCNVLSTRFEKLKGICDENGLTLHFVEEQSKLIMDGTGVDCDNDESMETE